MGRQACVEKPVCWRARNLGTCLLLLAAVGCGSMATLVTEIPAPAAEEAATIQPGDLIWLDVFNAKPEGSHRLQPGDMLFVSVPQALADQPINGSYLVEPGGNLNFGPAYGSVPVVGQTGEEAAAAIEQHLGGTLTDPQVAAKVVFTARQEDAQLLLLQEEYSGEHTVADDGTITLGNFGQVKVAGLTINQAARAVEQHATEVRLEVEVRAQQGSVCTVVLEDMPGGNETHPVELARGDTVRTVLERVVDLQSLRGKILWITPPSRIRPGLGRVRNIKVHDLNEESRGIHQPIFAGDTIHIGERETSEAITMRQIPPTGGVRRIPPESQLFQTGSSPASGHVAQ